MSEDPMTTWEQLMACSYCSHYQSVGTHAPINCCQNPCSPFYDPLAPDWMGTRLNTEQELRGCEKFQYTGQKIPVSVLKFIPNDSNLRSLPLEKLVEGLSDSQISVPLITCEQMARIFHNQYSDLLELFEEHGSLRLVDGCLVPAEKETK